jgi:hypothetical protein
MAVLAVVSVRMPIPVPPTTSLRRIRLRPIHRRAEVGAAVSPLETLGPVGRGPVQLSCTHLRKCGHLSQSA